GQAESLPHSLMISALDRKLLRDLTRIKAQALAIALVMACGVAAFVMALCTLISLEQTRAEYYQEHRFADVFARVTRAPLALEPRIAAIPGIATAQLRVVVDVN